MIRINELRLPLNPPPQALPRAIAERLKINETAIRQFKIFKRSNDVRKKNAPLFIYSVDVELAEADENAVLARFADDPKIALTPDTAGIDGDGLEPPEGVVGQGHRRASSTDRDQPVLNVVRKGPRPI